MYLLDLLGHLRLVLLTSSLRSLWSRLSVHDIIPPSEAARVVANELLVVNIVMLGTSPEREEVVQAPGELVSAVRIDSLKETAGDPEVHGKDVEVLREHGPEDRNEDGACAEDHGFNWRCVLGGKTEWSRVLVVDFVDVLVERPPVECAVHPVMPCIFQHEEDCNLIRDCSPRWEGNAGVHAAGLSHWVEEPDLG